MSSSTHKPASFSFSYSLGGTPPAAAAVPTPGPNLHNAPTQIDAGDRMVDVLMSMRSPRIVLFGNLLSAEECQALIETAQPRMQRSKTFSNVAGGYSSAVSPARTSDGTKFKREETPLVARIEARIARLVQWPQAHAEGLQIMYYRPGAEYKPHYDYFDPALPGTSTLTRNGGQRVASLVMYLQHSATGGGTTFPDVQLEVAPRQGSAVFFSYERPHPSTRTLHAGAPVISGDKWIATKWFREREYSAT